MAESSSSKRINETPTDRLNSLPDCLLIHILSLLNTKDAAITGALSKRWQFLWTQCPRFIFTEWSRESEKVRQFIASVSRTLAISSRRGLKHLSVNFWYDNRFALDVNIWVKFAVKNKVAEFSLLLGSVVDLYKLPQIIYSLPTLTCLRLRGYIMGTPIILEWKSLTSLFLHWVKLYGQVIDKVLSGCPHLHTLDLTNCWGKYHLKVNSQSLYFLRVIDHEEENKLSLREISAPYIQSLDILVFTGGRKLHLANISSLGTAKVEVCRSGKASSVKVMRYVEELSVKVQHVKELMLGCEFMKALSKLVMDGWQLPQSPRGFLKLQAYREMLNIYGIMGLLKSSPYLEKLAIKGCVPDETHFNLLGPAAKDDLGCELLHLKTVEITGFASENLDGEPMLTLARILLKRATILKKMVIGVHLHPQVPLAKFLKHCLLSKGPHKMQRL